MFTRRAYRRYVRKGGTKSNKSKKSDIIDTSDLEKPKVFSIQDVHDLLLEKKEPKEEYIDENQKEIDEYVKKAIGYDDEFEDEQLSQEDKLRLEELLIQTDSEDEDDKEEEKVDNNHHIVADMDQKELQKEELIKDIKDYYSSNKIVSQTSISRHMTTLSYEELIRVNDKSKQEMQEIDSMVKRGRNLDDRDMYFKHMALTNNYSTKEIFRRNISKMSRENMIDALNWLDDTRNENKGVPIIPFIKNLENLFVWKSDREVLIMFIKDEKYTREMKEIPSFDDLQILYELIFNQEHKQDLEKTHLAGDKTLLRRIWEREYKNRYFKEELAKGMRYEDIKDDLEANLRTTGFEETKDETDSDIDLYE